jgi:epoxyqueuosine reductase QueG
MRNLMMFKKLCGKQSLNSVVLATTMWGNVGAEEGRKREEQLKGTDSFWGEMVKAGSVVRRHDQGARSAQAIVKELVQMRRNMVLDIQKEMVDNNKTLDETAAGISLEGDLKRQAARHMKELEEVKMELKEARAKRNTKEAEELKNLKEELEAKARKIDEDRAMLKVDYGKMKEDVQVKKKSGWKLFRKVAKYAAIGVVGLMTGLII